MSGTISQSLQGTLEKELEPTHLEVYNESAMHNEVNVGPHVRTTLQ